MSTTTAPGWSVSSGRAAFWIAILGPVCSGSAIRAIGEVAPFPVTVAIYAAPGVASIALGVLSMLGKGRRLGTSNPILGGFGFAIGLLTVALPLLLLPAVSAAKNAAAARATQGG
jgi:hypothetical protein